MKIQVNKQEYAKLVRGCYEVSRATVVSNCNKCALKDLCSGEDSLADMVEIEEGGKQDETGSRG